MKVFFAFSTLRLDANINSYKKIVDFIVDDKNKLTVDLIAKAIREKGRPRLPNEKENAKQFHKEAIGGIEEADCVVAEVSLPSSGVGFQIGHALFLKKPVLCIYSKEFGNKNPPKVISSMNSPFLKISSYIEDTLKSVIHKFFENLPKQYLIKFNFIITPEIEEYLNWLHNKTGKSKSELLREKVVEKIICEDKEYKNFKNGKIRP